MNKVIVILGPTGVGKTKMSIELAKRLDGEIVNADSMQFYKDLNIGTAKIKEEEKENIPHHLFDIKEVSDDYSIFDYQKDGRKIIGDIFNRKRQSNHLFIVCWDRFSSCLFMANSNYAANFY